MTTSAKELSFIDIVNARRQDGNPPFFPPLMNLICRLDTSIHFLRLGIKTLYLGLRYQGLDRHCNQNNAWNIDCQP